MVLTQDKSTLRTQEPLRLTSYAHAFTGEVLSGTTATWNVKVSPASYTPPKLGTYKFGVTSGGSSGGEKSRLDTYTWESQKNYSGILKKREGQIKAQQKELKFLFRKTQSISCVRSHPFTSDTRGVLQCRGPKHQ